MVKRTQKQINKSNRQRGSKFEKTVADFLDMDVVPYSGSNARFGYGDVKDSIWLGECKNISLVNGRAKIKREWMDDNRAKAMRYELMPYLAWMPSGKPMKFIVLEEKAFNRMNVNFDIIVEIPNNDNIVVNAYIDIDDMWVKSLKNNAGIAKIIYGDFIFYMMSINLFKDIINRNGLKGSRLSYDIPINTG